MQKGAKRIKLSRKGIITLSLAVLVIISVVIGFFVITKNKAASSTSTSAQRQTQVVRGNIEVVLSGSGTVTSANTSDVMSNVQGKITKGYFKEGDKVKAGDLLFEIDDTDAKLNILKIENQISQAQLSITSNQKSFSNLSITAPFSGKVTNINAKVGESASNNMTLFTITDTSKLSLSVPFSITDIQDISIGQKVQVAIQEIYDTVEGVVTGIDEYTYTASNGGTVRNIEVTVNNPGRLTDTNTAMVEVTTPNGIKNSSEVSKFEYLNKQEVKAVTNGTFAEINIKENQYVNKGDVLIKIENDDLQITAQTNDLKVQDLSNQLEAAKKQLENYKIYSTISGTVTGDTAVAGDSVKSGDILISIRDFEQMQFTISVDELDISKVKVGQEVSITIDALEETTTRPLSGEVIYKAMEGASTNGVATYDVKIKINETENLLAGMNANASIILSQANDVLMLPLEAVTKMGDRAFVRVIGSEDSNSTQSGSRRALGNWGENKPDGNAPAGALDKQEAPVPQGKSAGGDKVVDQDKAGSQDKTGSQDKVGNQEKTGSQDRVSSQNKNNQNNQKNQKTQNNQNNQKNSQASSGRQMSAAMRANIEYYEGTVMKEVELGVNNDEYVEIKSGLTEGEIVVLPPLVANSTSSTPNTQNGFSIGGLGGMPGGVMPGGGMPAGGQNNRTSGSSSRQSGSQGQR